MAKEKRLRKNHTRRSKVFIQLGERRGDQGCGLGGWMRPDETWLMMNGNQRTAQMKCSFARQGQGMSSIGYERGTNVGIPGRVS